MPEQTLCSLPGCGRLAIKTGSKGQPLCRQCAEGRPKPAVRTSEAVGRNQLCPCGSGKKHKKCCRQDEAQTRRDAPALSDLTIFAEAALLADRLPGQIAVANGPAQAARTFTSIIEQGENRAGLL